MAGMDADAVLTEEQRQFRFRKVIELRNRNRSSSRTTNELSSGDETVTSEQQQQLQLQPDGLKMKKWAKLLQPKIEMIVQNYQTMELNSKLSDNFFTKLDSFKDQDLYFNIDADEILSYVIAMSEEFRHYANLHRYFLLKFSSY